MGNVNLKEKVAYLHGLTKGLSLDESSAEGKLLLNIVDVLDTVAQEVKSMNAAQSELEDYVESIDDDLSYLEEEIYSEEECEDSGEEDQDEDWVEMVCPNCKEIVTFEADVLDEEDEVEVTCPYCRGLVYDNTIEITEDRPFFNRESRHGAHPGI